MKFHEEKNLVFPFYLKASSRDSCFSVLSGDWEIKIISDCILLLHENKDSFNK